MQRPTIERLPAQPPETLEGWYALHQIFRADHARGTGWAESLTLPAVAEGWSAAVCLIGSTADVLVMTLAPTLDAIGDAEASVLGSAASLELERVASFLSVTEAGLYSATAELARDVAARCGELGDAEYVEAVRLRAASEQANPHVRRRLFPPLPEGMPYVSFYPMSKRRVVGQNWYALSIEERARMMQAHGATGRRYAGRVQQIITGSIGFEQWEWGVTLFAKDPIDIKKLVTEMRFDEASAEYAEFGEFYVGRVISR